MVIVSGKTKTVQTIIQVNFDTIVKRKHEAIDIDRTWKIITR